MDMLDQALDSSGHTAKTEDDDDHGGVTLQEVGEDETAITVAQAGLTLDPTLQYQFRTDNGQGGQVTYRVVQVAHDGTQEAQVINAFPAGAQIGQAVIPFTNGAGSPTPDGLGEARFAYIPTVTATDGTITDATAALGQVATAGELQAGATLDQVATADSSGQFYVMMSPQDMLQGQRTIAPRTHTMAPRIEGGRPGRDERRRATHNEVERRRRDKINNWIVQLSKLVPDCAQENVKSSNIGGSKGGILSKACDYITALRTANARMAESLKDMEKLTVDVELLRQQCEELKQENGVLRGALQQHGIVPPDMTGGTS